MLINGKRALAYIARIEEIKPIPDADKIEVARVGGWQVVVAKADNFKVGDEVVYIEVDSRVPSDRTEFAFLKDRKYKVKTIKLRGQVSQGLIVPKSALGANCNKYKEGEDVTEVLGIKKIEEEKPIVNRSREDKLKSAHPRLVRKKWFKVMMHYAWFRKLAFKFLIPKKKKNGWPAWVQHTDEERCQNMLWVLQNKAPMIVTEKIDGTSSTYSIKRERGRRWSFWVCSRNVVQEDMYKKNYHNGMGCEGNVYWEMALKYNIEDFLHWVAKKFEVESHVTAQGETWGEGLQGNKYSLDHRELSLFNLIVDGKRLSSVEGAALVEEYNAETKRENPIQWVPIIDTAFVLPDTFEELMAYSTGKSTLADTLREGYVFREPESDLSFKCVSNDFLLKWKC